MSTPVSNVVLDEKPTGVEKKTILCNSFALGQQLS
jgi:hypothetical protein